MEKVTAFILCCLLLAACSPQPPRNELSKESTVSEASVPSEAPTEASVPEDIILMLYLPDEELMRFTNTEVMVEALSEDIIIEQLIMHGVLIEGVRINMMERIVSSGTPGQTSLYIDLNSTFRELILSQGSAGERAIIGSLVNTFLTAYEAESITITVDAETLESGHVVYDFPLTFLP